MLRQSKRSVVVQRRDLSAQPIPVDTPQPHLPPQAKPLAEHLEILKPKRRKFSLYRILLIVLIGGALVAAGFFGTNAWLASTRFEVSSTTPSTKGSTATHQSQEGTDKTKPPVDVLAAYHVAPDLPRALYINKLGIAARIKPMSLNADNSIQAPINIYDSGWYDGSAKPGEPGAVFIDGHSSGASHFGLFGRLDSLVVGDEIQVEKGDGTRVSYKVVHTDVVDLDKVDMNSMLKPYGDAVNGLNLMTCAGNWINNDTTLNKRVLVYTEQI